jgi:hypothetical protein
MIATFKRNLMIKIIKERETKIMSGRQEKTVKCNYLVVLLNSTSLEQNKKCLKLCALNIQFLCGFILVEFIY